MPTKPRKRIPVILSVLLLSLSLPPAAAAADAGDPDGLDFARLAAIRSVGSVAISPDGTLVAYTLSVPRSPGAGDDGRAWTELHVAEVASGRQRAFVTGEVNVSGVRFSPDGRQVTYLAKRGDDEEIGVWGISVAGGESRKLMTYEARIRDYRLSPDGKRIAFVATEPASDEKEKLKKKGYKQEVFEEDWRPRKIFVAALPDPDAAPSDPSLGDDEEASDEPVALEVSGSVFGLEWAPGGERLVLTIAPRPLIDDQYMLQRVHVVDADSGEVQTVLQNPGKLGNFRVSPDGKWVAMISAADPNDPNEGRLMIGSTAGGPLTDLLPEFEGHVSGIAWQDPRTVMYIADERSETLLGEVDVAGEGRKIHTRSGTDGGPILLNLSLSADGKTAALRGQSPSHPNELFVMRHGDVAPQRLTDSNPWLGDVKLARQEVLTHEARDGLELEGILIHPLSPDGGGPAPLMLIVHGGPESHVRNGWVTTYSRPGQLAAARGYAVFYPNYRGSTGRGVAFSKLGQGDAAGKEFDDLIDAVDHLVAEGIADRERVGITGGSYGGYATAWCSTRFTDRFRAGVMFVGISNKLSKGLTTEIPIEDVMVHTRFDPWTRWQFSLERSPIFHAEKSRTALLIATGTADSRVHPSQSLQLYRALKLIDKTPVRFVRYPGEGHGNRKAAARDDYARRLMRWMDHFVLEENTELPPIELELGLDEDEEDDETADD